MSKKRYIIISLVIVSVLLGSILYSNLVLAGNMTPSGKPELQIYKDSAEMIVFDTRGGDRNYGAHISLPYDSPEFPFVFLPRKDFIQITDIWITLVVARIGGTPSNLYKLDVVLNDNVTITTGSKTFADYTLSVYTVHIQEHSVYTVIDEGINKLTLTNPLVFTGIEWVYSPMIIFKATVFIEY